jgi:catechol 2,3-dioxygenase
MAELAKLGHVAFETPDLEESLWFFRDLMGLKVVEREGDTAYLCGMRDFDHHTMSLTEGSEGGVDHIAWRAVDPESVAAYASRMAELGVETEWVGAGEETGLGEAVRFETPTGHPWEIYYDVEQPVAPEEMRSQIPTRRYSPEHANRVSPQRIDHVHVQDPAAADHAELLEEDFDFRLNELFKKSDGTIWGWWLAVTPLPHNIGIHRIDADESRFHHISYHLDHLQDMWDAADILSERGVEIDAGPGKHAITNANYLYVKDPASDIRIELFAGPGYLNFEPDWEPIVWEEEIGTASDHQWFGDQYDADGVPYV